MNALARFALSSVALVACAGRGSPATEPPGPGVSTLERIASRYRQRQPIAIDFVQTTHSYVFGSGTTSRGVLYVAPPNLRFDYLSADREVVLRSYVIDPPYVVSIDHRRRERCRRRRPTPLVYLVFAGGLDQRATATSGSDGSALTLRLRPRSPDERWSEAVLRVGRDTLLIRSLDVFRERENDTNALHFASARPVERVPPLNTEGYRCPDP